jgi:hypothetical protein
MQLKKALVVSTVLLFTARSLRCEPTHCAKGQSGPRSILKLQQFTARPPRLCSFSPPGEPYIFSHTGLQQCIFYAVPFFYSHMLQSAASKEVCQSIACDMRCGLLGIGFHPWRQCGNWALIHTTMQSVLKICHWTKPPKPTNTPQHTLLQCACAYVITHKHTKRSVRTKRRPV